MIVQNQHFIINKLYILNFCNIKIFLTFYSHFFLFLRNILMFFIFYLKNIFSYFVKNHIIFFKEILNSVCLSIFKKHENIKLFKNCI